jgi:predicted nucleic acid-binding Zn ribbon protein
MHSKRYRSVSINVVLCSSLNTIVIYDGKNAAAPWTVLTEYSCSNLCKNSLERERQRRDETIRKMLIWHSISNTTILVGECLIARGNLLKKAYTMTHLMTNDT